MKKTNKILAILAGVVMMALSSCNGTKNLVVPHGVNTADAIPASALNLQKGQYDILQTISESASVTAQYKGTSLTIKSGDGAFAYYFTFDNKTGWTLKSFSGTATLGYYLTEESTVGDMPQAEEFARRVAIAKLIEQVKDYGGDGILEPIITTRVSNAGDKTVEYQATATAKIVKIHSTTRKK